MEHCHSHLLPERGTREEKRERQSGKEGRNFSIFVNKLLMQCSKDKVWADRLSITRWKFIYHKMSYSKCHTLNAQQINFPSFNIDLDYLWQTKR